MSRHIHSCEVAVIGAGPYGLSVAAHLDAAEVTTRVFGEPMAFWQRNMPRGMLLRSPWRATHLSDPDGTLSLDTYAAAKGIDPRQLLPLEQFVGYGQWFQSRAVPDLDRRAVKIVDAAASGFRLTLDDGETLTAGRVVIATGLRNQEYRPPAFRDVPRRLASHTSEHVDLAQFCGKRIAVIGRGQSACESAALLAEAGAEVDLIGRGAIHWLGVGPRAAAPESAMRRLRELLKAPSEVGPFPLSWLVELPGLVRHLPTPLREEFSRRCLKPGAAGWLRPRFGKVARVASAAIIRVRPQSDRIVLEFDDGTRDFDHVLLGTGYRIDLSRLGILSSELLQRIAAAEGSPLLGRGFESSVPGLHFVGSYAVKSFGPLLRFIAGAPFAAAAVATAARRLRATMDATFVPAATALGPASAQLSPPR